MTAAVDTVNLTNTETVVVQDFYPESVSLTHTERIVERQQESTVVVTGVLAPVSIPSMSDISNVDLSQLSNGSMLVYQENRAKWLATKTLEDQIMNGGFF